MSDDLSTEVAKQALEPLGDLLRKIAGPLADEIGESLGVWARHYRFRLGLRMLQKTERMLKEAGITPKLFPRDCSCRSLTVPQLRTMRICIHAGLRFWRTRARLRTRCILLSSRFSGNLRRTTLTCWINSTIHVPRKGYVGLPLGLTRSPTPS